MGKSSDQLREELDAQRSEAGAKIDNLQDQVQTQIQDTREQVTETAEHVRDEAQAMVTDTVDAVKQTVDNMDFEQMVQDRPLLSVGAAMLGGFMLGAILGGDNNSSHNQGSYNNSGMGSSTGGQNGGYSGSHSSSGGIGQSLRSAAQKSGLEETISNAGAALMGSVTEQLKGMVDQNFPGFSEKLDTAQRQSGSFKEKANSAQQEAQKQ